MSGSFGEALEQAIDAAGLSQRAFARRVSCSQSILNRVIRGDRKPPLDHLLHWLSALELSAPERERLTIMAELEHSPPGIQRRFRALEAELQTRRGKRERS